MTDREIEEMINHILGGRNRTHPGVSEIQIKNVVFNPPATIVFWSDDTKTVVQCQDGDTYDPEKGLMAAILKRVCGNSGRYNELIRDCMNKYYHPDIPKKVKIKKKPKQDETAVSEEKVGE